MTKDEQVRECVLCGATTKSVTNIPKGWAEYGGYGGGLVCGGCEAARPIGAIIGMLRRRPGATW